MKIIKYPSESDVNKAICDNEPLLALISFDGKTVITSQIDEAVEHHILLMKTGFKDTDIDKFLESFLIKTVRTGLLYVLLITKTFKTNKGESVSFIRTVSVLFLMCCMI